MGTAANILHSAQEKVENMAPSPEALRASCQGTLNSAYNAIRGSGSVMTELNRVKDAYIGLPVDAVAGGLKACGQLLTLQPVNATCTAGKALVATCQNLAKITTSPIPIALAAAENSLHAAKKVVVDVPRTAALTGIRTVERGLNAGLNLFGPTSESTSASSKAPDLGGASVAAPSAPQAV